ncbi:MAG: hypothetical protein ABA06_00455 [Parcubacteria bacterium C7867-001]|nr:MAG: hypothetical protein ABA06_00455 [Parcubacteria bacterium C7867-001]
MFNTKVALAAAAAFALCFGVASLAPAHAASPADVRKVAHMVENHGSCVKPGSTSDSVLVTIDQRTYAITYVKKFNVISIYSAGLTSVNAPMDKGLTGIADTDQAAYDAMIKTLVTKQPACAAPSA